MAKPGVHPFILVLDHLKAGFNVPKIFRSAEVFGAAEIHLINIEAFDPAAAKGAFRKVPARFLVNFEQSHGNLKQRDYRLFALDAESPLSITDIPLPLRSAFVLGHEEMGLSFDPGDYPGLQTIRIPQFGQTDSLNVSVAASIVMYEYIRQQQSRGQDAS